MSVFPVRRQSVYNHVTHRCSDSNLNCVPQEPCMRPFALRTMYAHNICPWRTVQAEVVVVVVVISLSSFLTIQKIKGENTAAEKKV